MSKRRRKRQEEQKREKRPAPTSNAVSRMADFFPADLTKKLKEMSAKEKAQATSQALPSKQQSPKPPSSHQGYSAKLSSPTHTAVKSTPIRVQPAKSAPTRKVSKAYGKSPTISLANVVIGAGLRKKSRSLQIKPRVVAGQNTPSELENQESAARQAKYNKVIGEGLSEHFENPIYINLGIDLGTSFSKVVWRSGDTSRPICFGRDPAKLADYFVPSIVTFDGKRVSVALPSDNTETNSEFSIPNFKMCLACVGAPSSDCQPTNCTLSNWWTVLPLFHQAKEGVSFVNALFLAKLVFHSKNLIREELEKMGLKGQALRWSANLAVPERYMDDSPILGCFEDVLKTAWLMSSVFERSGDLNGFEEALDCYLSAKQTVGHSPALDCFVYPEVGAEAASVIKSRSAKQGLYVFVDIGAGTIDASVFRFHRNHEGENHDTYAAQVLKAGAAHVEMEASSKLATESRMWFRRIKEGTVPIEVASTSVGETIRPFLARALDDLSKEIEGDLILLFRQAYEKENLAERWTDIQLVLGGGGAQLPAYVEAARGAFSLKNGPVGANITEVTLPAPKDFHTEALSREVFDRFAVAYGLSFHQANLPRWVPPREVKSLPPMPTKGRIDPDDR